MIFEFVSFRIACDGCGRVWPPGTTTDLKMSKRIATSHGWWVEKAAKGARVLCPRHNTKKRRKV